MPMERDRYIPNWDDFSKQLKDGKRWTCEACGKQCRKPKEPLSEFIERVWGGIDGDAWKEVVDYPGRFVLTTAHLDQNPKNDAPSNLQALCTVCHLNHDRPHQQANAHAKKARKGQKELDL